MKEKIDLNYFVFVIAILLVLAGSVRSLHAQSGAKESNTLILPFVGRTAGVGVYYGPAFIFQNIGNSPASIAGGKVFGRANAEAVVATGIPIITDTLSLSTGLLNINELYFDTSYAREMVADEKVTQITNGQGVGAVLNWRFLDNHLQFSNAVAAWNMKFDGYQNEDGDDIALPGVHLGDLNTTFFINSLTIDFTDEPESPRSGWKAGASVNSARTATEYSGTDTVSFFANGYIPVGTHSSLVFRGFSSNASVTKKATTSESEIRDLLNIDCSGILSTEKQTECQELEDGLVQNLKSHNKLGTATPLGGSRMLRSFREARFRGKHSVFAGSEFRWNSPDVIGKSLLQIAFFAETGSVSDTGDRLWETSRSSYGTALRLMFGQLTVRLEAATGDEGQEWHMTIGDPW